MALYEETYFPSCHLHGEFSEVLSEFLWPPARCPSRCSEFPICKAYKCYVPTPLGQLKINLSIKIPTSRNSCSVLR